MFQQEQDELSSRLAKEIDVRSSLEKKLKLAEEAKEIMKDQLDLYEEEISSLKLSLEAQQALIAESETKIEALEDDMDAAERMLARSKEMESMLEEYMNEVKELENKEAELQEMCRDKVSLFWHFENPCFDYRSLGLIFIYSSYYTHWHLHFLTSRTS